MGKEQILSAIKMLACSQGFYGRLYEAIMEDETNEIIDTLVEQNFKDTLDMVLFIEC